MENIIAFRGETRKLLLPIKQDNLGITGELPLVAIQRSDDDYFYESAWSATAPKRGAITVYANPGGGKTTCTSVGHTLVNGNKVFIRGTTNYDNPITSYTVSGVAGNDFDIDTAFVADDATGDWYFGFNPMAAEGAVPKPGLYSYSVTLLTTADKYIIHFENNDVNGFGINEYTYLIANMSETGERNVDSVFTGTGDADDVDLRMRSLKVSNDDGTVNSGYGVHLISSVDIGLFVQSTGDAVEKPAVKFSSFRAEGLYIEASTGPYDAAGLKITGKGTGPAVDLIPGLTGIGLRIAGGATSGDGINVSTTDGDAVSLAAAGNGQHAMELIATAGRGINIVSTSAGIKVVTSATSSHGIEIETAGNFAYGVKVNAINYTAVRLIGGGNKGLHISGWGAYTGVLITGGTTSGNGIEIAGGGTGHGAHLKSGTGVTGDALKLEALSTNGNAAHLTGKGTGIGLLLDSDTTGKGLKILQRTKTIDEDLMEIIWSKVAGKSTLGNTGGANEIEEKYYNYAEGAAIKTNTILKPDLTDNKDNLDANAMAGKEQ